MVDLKLGRLPDLQAALTDYAALYAQAYGREEPITELIPAMLAAFLDSDRSFTKARDDAKRGRA